MADYKPIQVGLDMKNYNAFFFLKKVMVKVHSKLNYVFNKKDLFLLGLLVKKRRKSRKRVKLYVDQGILVKTHSPFLISTDRTLR